MKKQYLIWIRLLVKRLWKQPAYVGLLVLIPVLGFAAGALERGERSGVEVAVCVEEGPWSEEILAGLREQETDSVLRFVQFADSGEVERRVASGEAECGFVLGGDLAQRVPAGQWRKGIRVYERNESVVTGIAKERIAGVIFRLYSEACYADHMGQFPEAAAAFAMEAYESHLEDDSTFGFVYVYDDSISQPDPDIAVVNDEPVNAAVFPVKGVFAVLIFLGGMCGMLEYERDREEKRFVRLAPDLLTYLVNIWISTALPAVAVLVCLWLYDGTRSGGGPFSPGRMLSVWHMGMWVEQTAHLLLYQGVIMAYCVILKALLRRRETIAAAMPILALGSLVCAPVFIRLGAYLPVFTILEKLFPATYYLML